MGTSAPPFFGHFVILHLLQMVAASTEQFRVNALTGPILAPLGGNVELSCQLSPPQSAGHMEIRWFRDRYTQPIYLYRDGTDQYGKTISRYVERTELLKDAIGEGKVTLRIFNVTAADDGPYRCFFRDGDFYEEGITEVKVTASSSDIQIQVHLPTTKGLMLECHSGGWFPQPQAEWRDSRGEILPPASKSYSQDKDKLFNMKMTLLLSDNSHRNVTCYLRNPLTGQEERTSIVLPNKLFLWKKIWIIIVVTIMIVLVSSVLWPTVSEPKPQSSCSRWNSPCAVGTIIAISSVFMNSIFIICLYKKERVPVSDPLFELDAVWMEDIIVILCVLMVFVTILISFIYFKLRDHIQSEKVNRESTPSETVPLSTRREQDAEISE